MMMRKTTTTIIIPLRFLQLCCFGALLILILFVGKVEGWGVLVSPSSSSTTSRLSFQTRNRKASSLSMADSTHNNSEDDDPITSKYNLGIGKNLPVAEVTSNHDDDDDDDTNGINDGGFDPSFWNVPDPVTKPADYEPFQGSSRNKNNNNNNNNNLDLLPSRPQTVDVDAPMKTRRMVARDNDAQRFRGIIDENHYLKEEQDDKTARRYPVNNNAATGEDIMNGSSINRPTAFYPDIDLSIPDAVYCPDNNVDLVWDLLRWEAHQQAQQEPLLVSFLHSTILNHHSLESSLAFLLANRLQSPAMMVSTQLQSLILDALKCSTFRRALRADMMAVRDRDPACAYLPDVFLYFKGFHALQSHRVAHVLWSQGRQMLALYLQSQVSQIFQIDIHPNATLGSGIMLDHGTGIVIGETASVGHNCSILHHVTLGGSGKKGLVRHPQVGDGVLLGAGATVLGPVMIGDGSQVGAGTLVITDLPSHCVAVGVPARIIGSFVDVTQQPSMSMDQMMDDKNIVTFLSDGI